MLDVVFFSRIIPLQIKEQVQKKRKGTMSESGESLEWKIIEGLNYNLDEKVVLYNYMPIQSWPKSYSEPYVVGGIFKHIDGTIINNLPFLNVSLIKRVFMGHSLYKEIRKWAKKRDSKDKVIILYSLTPEFLKAARIAKRINPDIVVFSIVADMPEYTVLDAHISFLTKVYLKWLKATTTKLLPYVDGFALLTEQMKDKIGFGKKCIVMEGICSEGIEQNQLSQKTIVYAGTLHKRFGIMNLVDSMKYVKDKTYKLVICGIGDCESQIKEMAKKDNRIVFKGQLSRDDILKELSSCSIIVNPRNGSEDFTKYSFPSKNLEALSSGKPLIAYRLSGIPDDYNDLIVYPSDETIEELGNTINTVIGNYDHFLNKARKARQYVLENKSKEFQSSRIVRAIKEIIDDKKANIV